jgi:hypothetical protein
VSSPACDDQACVRLSSCLHVSTTPKSYKRNVFLLTDW